MFCLKCLSSHRQMLNQCSMVSHCLWCLLNTEPTMGLLASYFLEPILFLLVYLTGTWGYPHSDWCHQHLPEDCHYWHCSSYLHWWPHHCHGRRILRQRKCSWGTVTIGIFIISLPQDILDKPASLKIGKFISLMLSKGIWALASPLLGMFNIEFAWFPLPPPFLIDLLFSCLVKWRTFVFH